MNALNAYWTSMIGKRALLSRLSLSPHEDRVMEVSPSGHHVRFEKNGWDVGASYTLIELLEPAAPDIIDVFTVGDKPAPATMGDFTPEVVGDPRSHADFAFSPEAPGEACMHRIPSPTDFGHTRFQALCNSFNNI